MSKEMIISVNGREKKIAILDNGKVTEFYIERGEENSGIAGNIYKGRVQRVLPGMQSAFVSIGLERDAFLYVTDFFDEEEEIERIVMEKSKKISPEEAKREANDKIDRARIEREKQMDAAQELTEPLAEAGVAIEEVETDATADVTLDTAPDQADRNAAPDSARNKRGRGRRGRGGRDEQPEPASETGESGVETRAPFFEIEDSGFERVIDDEETTGDMFKDAYMQERIVDQVRRIEFDMETTSEAAVGSLLGSVIEAPSGFERIADEDETPAADDAQSKKRKGPAKSSHGKFSKTSKKKKGDSDDDSAEAEPAAKAKKKPAASKSAKAKTTRSKAKKEGDALEDGEASVSEPSDIAEMTVRRGGRGRRRGGRGRRGATDASGEIIEGEETGLEGEDESNIEVAGDGSAEVVTAELSDDRGPEISEPKTEPVEKTESKPSSRGGRGGRGGDRGADRNADRNVERPERGADRGAERGSERGEQRGGRDNRDNRGGRNGQGGRGGRDRDRGPQPTISELLREGQEILVQIAKEPIARKGARITSHIALPGRFLVYMPTIEHLGVSRKIESASERGRLRTLIQKIKQDEDVPSGGFIVRTAGVGIADEDLRQDARYLVR